MSRKSFDPRECIEALNTIKSGIQMTEKPVTKEYLIDSFKNCGLPCNAVFWSVFKNSGILQEVSKGRFMFASKNPIYIERLANIQRKYIEIKRQYRKVPEVVESPVEVDPIQEAIALLKSHGYQVLVPVDTLYRII